MSYIIIEVSLYYKYNTQYYYKRLSATSQMSAYSPSIFVTREKITFSSYHVFCSLRSPASAFVR